MPDTLPHASFIKEITALPFVQAVYLFGSRARGDNAERSDIDIAVDATGAEAQEWNKVMQIVQEKADTLLKIDCVRYDELKEDDSLKKAINRDRKILFERKA